MTAVTFAEHLLVSVGAFRCLAGMTRILLMSMLLLQRATIFN